MLHSSSQHNSHQENKFKRPLQTNNHKKNVILINFWISLCVVVLSKIDCVNGSLRVGDSNFVRINKCCEKFEVIVDNKCTDARELNASK